MDRDLHRPLARTCLNQGLYARLGFTRYTLQAGIALDRERHPIDSPHPFYEKMPVSDQIRPLHSQWSVIIRIHTRSHIDDSPSLDEIYSPSNSEQYTFDRVRRAWDYQVHPRDHTITQGQFQSRGILRRSRSLSHEVEDGGVERLDPKKIFLNPARERAEITFSLAWSALNLQAFGISTSPSWTRRSQIAISPSRCAENVLSMKWMLSYSLPPTKL